MVSVVVLWEVVTMAVAMAVAVPGVLMVEDTVVVIMVVVLGRVALVPVIVVVITVPVDTEAVPVSITVMVVIMVVVAVGRVVLCPEVSITVVITAVGPSGKAVGPSAKALVMVVMDVMDTREPKDTDTRERNIMVDIMDMDTKERKGIVEEGLEKEWESEKESGKVSVVDPDMAVIIVVIWNTTKKVITRPLMITTTKMPKNILTF
mmetsp:Transcript_19659/g.21105  ORF Transcript_19659/g.21105 Transcript_19659/m.21105 type:complete len:206 (+) Transcript_19659:1179-1796(+)